MTLWRSFGVVLIATAAVAYDQPTFAHHSYAATYYLDQTVEIRGEIMVFMYRNPHSIIQLMATDKDGQKVRWACEWAGTLSLDQKGVNRMTLKPGEEVIVSGVPGRNPEDRRLLIKSIERPADGWKWVGDSSK